MYEESAKKWAKMSCKAAESHEVAVLRMARVNCNIFPNFFPIFFFTVLIPRKFHTCNAIILTYSPVRNYQLSDLLSNNSDPWIEPRERYYGSNPAKGVEVIHSRSLSLTRSQISSTPSAWDYRLPGYISFSAIVYKRVWGQKVFFPQTLFIIIAQKKLVLSKPNIELFLKLYKTDNTSSHSSLPCHFWLVLKCLSLPTLG